LQSGPDAWQECGEPQWWSMLYLGYAYFTTLSICRSINGLLGRGGPGDQASDWQQHFNRQKDIGTDRGSRIDAFGQVDLLP
jgi:hypothetical protein